MRSAWGRGARRTSPPWPSRTRERVVEPVRGQIVLTGAESPTSHPASAQTPPTDGTLFRRQGLRHRRHLWCGRPDVSTGRGPRCRADRRRLCSSTGECAHSATGSLAEGLLRRPRRRAGRGRGRPGHHRQRPGVRGHAPKVKPTFYSALGLPCAPRSAAAPPPLPTSTGGHAVPARGHPRVCGPGRAPDSATRTSSPQQAVRLRRGGADVPTAQELPAGAAYAASHPINAMAADARAVALWGHQRAVPRAGEQVMAAMRHGTRRLVVTGGRLVLPDGTADARSGPRRKDCEIPPAGATPPAQRWISAAGSYALPGLIDPRPLPMPGLTTRRTGPTAAARRSPAG